MASHPAYRIYLRETNAHIYLINYLNKHLKTADYSRPNNAGYSQPDNRAILRQGGAHTALKAYFHQNELILVSKKKVVLALATLAIEPSNRAPFKQANICKIFDLAQRWQRYDETEKTRINNAKRLIQHPHSDLLTIKVEKVPSP